MTLHTRFDRWTALLLATLGATQLAGCGGRTTAEEVGAGGSGGGNGSDGGTGATGGSAGGSGGTGGIITGGTGGIVTGGGPLPPTPGRPFLIDGHRRQASLCRSDEWQDSNIAPRTEHLDVVERGRLAKAWSEAALLEHASIAAFARFTLQLLALGAPASLVEAATAAMAEETTHARMAFAVASAYAGHALGPDPLSMAGALEATSLRDVVLATIREGCIGETVSAIQANEALFYVTDPALRKVLASIAEDETRHAQVAWRFVRWALEQGDDELRRAVRDEFARARASIAASPPLSSLDTDELALLAGGAVPERLGEHLRAECARRVILPCADALFARHSSDATGAQSQLPCA